MQKSAGRSHALSFINELMTCLETRQGAEIRLEPGCPPMIIEHGNLVNLSNTPIQSDQLMEIAASIVPDALRQSFAEKNVCNFEHFPFGARPHLNYKFIVTLLFRSQTLPVSIIVCRTQP